MGMNRKQDASPPTDGVEVPSLDALLTVPQVTERLQVSEKSGRSLFRAGELRGGSLGVRAGWRVRASAVERPLRAKTPFKEKNRLEREASDG